ncbi:DMT family transporter [Pseudoroseomonas sp. WGS1072]|uniref:DMT family transporter n=1 Tax=Roseomonas sp. WGS1072 TaxID=3366816 RepID=UPI003BEFAE87
MVRSRRPETPRREDGQGVSDISSLAAAPSSDRRTGFALLLVTATGWGFTWPVLKTVLQDLPPLAARGSAALLAAAGLAIAAMLMRLPLRVPRGEWSSLALAALLNFSAWMGLSTLGLTWLSSGEGAIVSATLPVWTTLLAWLMLGEKPGAAQTLALPLGLLGVVVLVGGQPLGLGLGKLPGVALILAAALCFGTGAVMSKRRPLRLPPLTQVVWQVGLGCLPILGASWLVERPEWGQVSILGWAGVIYMAVLPLSVCYITWFAALRRLPAGIAAMGTLLVPVLAVLAGVLLLGEPLGWQHAVALALILTSILLASRR